MNLQLGVLLCIVAVASSALLGGFTPVDVQDEGVHEVVEWTVAHMNGMLNSPYHHVLLGEPQITRQVVNGLMYHLVIHLAPTTCRNNANNLKKSVTDCPVSNKAHHQECDIKVFDFRGKYSLKDFQCNPKKSVGLLGGDDHDYLPHKRAKKDSNHRQILGQDGHDYVPHTKSGVPRDIHHMSILGGDDTDFKPHQGDACFEYYQQFVEFKAKYNRLYGAKQEEAKRFQIFCTNMKNVKLYQEMEKGTATYGATIFADLSEEEFSKSHLGFKVSETKGKDWPAADIPKGIAPKSFDWRDHGAVTNVKNQGQCGSCWAFSTTGNIEGQYAVKHKKLVSLSEQELVDCDHVDQGCEGGLPSQAYEALEKLGGIEKESDYSYEGVDEKCHFNKSKVAVKLSGAVNISSNEEDMAAWLAKNGPISIGINAFAMQFYFGGIAHPWKIFCNPKKLDHGVLIVGYGVDGSEPYWIIKNSWGPSWGRKGYYYVYRGDGVCGLNTMCTSAVVE